MSSLRKARAELQKLQDQVAAKSPIPKSGIIHINDDLNETREQVCERLGIDPNTPGLVFLYRNAADDRTLWPSGVHR